MDLRDEPERVHAMYGTAPGKASFANNCLLARRLIERGVRFVQLFDNEWDHHTAIFENLPKKCAQVDRPAAALVRDLKDRGLLDETLVIFATEFGRTPMAQMEDENGAKAAVGRDHDLSTFTIWLAGGGVKAGHEHGRSDDIGYRAVENPVSVYDLNATLLHLLGIDHEKLTYRFQGRDFRLTDVHGEVVHSIIA
jgi:arylsulfatase A-like enzyme